MTWLITLFAKYAIGNKVKAIGEFLADYWKWILVVGILAYCWNSYRHEVERADKSEKALAEFVVRSAKAAADREKENIAKFNLAQTRIAVLAVQHKAEIERLNLDRARETKKLKELYETRNSNANFNWSERVRIEAERNRLGLPETAESTAGLTESLRECDAAYSTLEKACQITTIDFNTCRVWADTACGMIGCE
jgi:hypothetical protein